MALRILDVKITVTIKHNSKSLKALVEWLSNLLTIDLFKQFDGLALVGIDSENPWYAQPGVRTTQKEARRGSITPVHDEKPVGTDYAQGELLVADRPGSTTSQEIRNYVESEVASFMSEYVQQTPDYLAYTKVIDVHGIPGFEDEDVKEFIGSLRAYLKDQSGSDMTMHDLFGINVDKPLQSSVQRLIIAWFIQIGEIQRVGKDRYHFLS